MCVSVCYIKCLPEFHPYKRTLDSGSKDQFRKKMEILSEHKC